MSQERKNRILVGEVVSTSMDKTVVVKVTRRVQHPVYKKYINQYKKYMAHVAGVEPSMGDVVKISATRPLSRHKRWQVSQIIRESVKIG